MANPHKGEVTFEAKGETWTLRYNTNVICSLEDELDMGIEDILERLQDSPRMSRVRTVFRYGLGDVSEELAGDLIDEIGIRRAANMFGEAFKRAFPTPGPGGGARPPKGAAAGTGKRS